MRDMGPRRRDGWAWWQTAQAEADARWAADELDPDGWPRTPAELPGFLDYPEPYSSGQPYQATLGEQWDAPAVCDHGMPVGRDCRACEAEAGQARVAADYAGPDQAENAVAGWVGGWSSSGPVPCGTCGGHGGTYDGGVCSQCGGSGVA